MIDDLWYKNAVVYSLDLESYMDGNGDGVGDFEGLTGRLDHLEFLGVDTIWLAPFQPSPNKDNGYDVRDYYGVDQRHGSSGDFVEFMHQARNRGLRVIMDLVVNHTSDQHPWFQEARKDPASRYRDWYVWSKKRPTDWKTGMVFPGVQHSTWTFDDVARHWYFHRFYDHQPDLDMQHPDVRREIARIMGYWIALGVSGFRVDAVPFIIETPAPGPEMPVLHFEYLEEMHRVAQWRRGDAILLGEANVTPDETKDYFGTGGRGIQMMFNFWVNQRIFLALASGDTRPLQKALKETKKHPPASQWAQFLRNHDELDLGRLTEEERAAVYARFGPEPRMQLYDRGIRRRLAPMLGGDRRLVELANSLLFALPGTPVLRYGDEIMMGEDLSLKERDAVRTPMQWSDERNGGFSAAEKTYLPAVSGGVYGYERVNVAAQRRDPNSFLNWTASMVRVRRECPEIGWGDWRILPTGHAEVLALCYTWRHNTIVTLHNFADQACDVRVRLGEEVAGGDLLVDILRQQESRAGEDGAHRLALDPYGYRWFRVGGLRRLP